MNDTVLDPDVRLLIEELIRACAKRQYCLAGYVFGAGNTPFIMRISTFEDDGNSKELFERLCDMMDARAGAIEKREVRMKGDA